MLRSMLVVLLFLAASVAQAGPFDKMLTVVPGTTNSLVLINAEAVYASPLAKALKWAEGYSQRFKTGVSTIPPDAKLVAIACSTNMRETTRDWQLVLTKVPQVPNANALAKREGGTVDEVAGRFAVLSPRDVYFTSIGEDASAAWYPANRQLLAHWMRGVKAASERTENSLSPFLKDVVTANAAPIVVAFDLTDAYDLASVRQAVDESPVVTAKNINKDSLAKFIAGIRGLTLAINVTDKMEGTLRAEFSADPTLYKTVLKEFLIEAIEDEGASLDDLSKWDASFDNKSMTLKGTFDPAAMARLMTLFEFPSEEDSGSENPMDSKPTADATKKYFKAVLGIIEEVRAFKNKADYEKTATWHETYARKIGQISTRHVDADAVQFAQATGERFRGIASSLRGVPLDVKRLEAGAHAYVDTRVIGRGWGGRGRAVHLNTNIPKTREQIAKVIVDDSKKRNEIWNIVEKSISETRAKLTTKYGNGF